MATKYIIHHDTEGVRKLVMHRFDGQPVITRSQFTISGKYRMAVIDAVLNEWMAAGIIGSAEVYVHHTLTTVYYLKAEEPLIFGYFQRRQNQPRRVIA